MNIVKEYRKLEDILEVHVYALPGDEFYVPAPREFEVEEVPFPELLSNIPMDIHILVPYNDGRTLLSMVWEMFQLKEVIFLKRMLRGDC